MPITGEHKTVQARVLDYAEVIGWTLVSRAEVEQRRGFDPDVPPPDRAKNRSLFFDDLLDAKLREFHPRCAVGVRCRNCPSKVPLQQSGEPIKQEIYIVRYCD